MDEKELNIQDTANYSKQNGTMIKSLDSRVYKIQKRQEANCKWCESDNKSDDSYCKYCGRELYIIKTNKEVIDNKYNFRQAFKTSLLAIILLFGVSMIYKGIIFMEGSDINSLINPLHILLAMNVGKINLFMASTYSANSTMIQLGMIVVAVLPIVAISISNFVFMKNKNNSIKSISINSAFVGILYGCMLGVLSIFTKNRVNVSDTLMYTGALVYSFTLFSAIINGFILGFISTFIVGIFRIKDKGTSVDIIKLALKTVGLGIACILIILMVVSMLSKNFIHDLGLFNYVDKLSIGVILIQLAVYLWAYANLIPVMVGKISLSVLGLSSTGLFLNTKLLLIALVFVSILILLVVGNTLKLKYNKQNINVIKRFSVSYALIMGVLSILTRIVVEGNSSYSLEMGFGILISVVVSYLYSYVITLIGYKLS